jgi:hypothetical protein
MSRTILNARNHLPAVPLGNQESFCCKLMTTILNARDQDGNTALHLAVLSGNQESFCVLWTFLLQLMQHIGFPLRWTNWVSNLPSSPSIKLLLHFPCSRTPPAWWHHRANMHRASLSDDMVVSPHHSYIFSWATCNAFRGASVMGTGFGKCSISPLDAMMKRWVPA